MAPRRSTLEATHRLMADAFEMTDVQRIYALIFPENRQSSRVAEKLGMHLDGLLRSNRELRGRRGDEAVCSMLRDDPGRPGLG